MDSILPGSLPDRVEGITHRNLGPEPLPPPAVAAQDPFIELVIRDIVASLPAELAKRMEAAPTVAGVYDWIAAGALYRWAAGCNLHAAQAFLAELGHDPKRASLALVKALSARMEPPLRDARREPHRGSGDKAPPPGHEREDSSGHPGGKKSDPFPGFPTQGLSKGPGPKTGTRPFSPGAGKEELENKTGAKPRRTGPPPRDAQWRRNDRIGLALQLAVACAILVCRGLLFYLFSRYGGSSTAGVVWRMGEFLGVVCLGGWEVILAPQLMEGVRQWPARLLGS